MRYFSTRNTNEKVSFAEAALSGLAPDGGLFVPEEIPVYRASVLKSFDSIAFHDLAFETILPFVQPEIKAGVLREIIESAFNFPAPLVAAGGEAGRRPVRYYVLELFHGPTAAFKDFGARFMARAFSYLRRGESRPLKILVATSGDTGGAVADGFFQVPGISVTVLYPAGRVTPLQERQIAGLGGNISAISVDGSFDDCQRLVKAAFNNKELRKKIELSSANSINIARLIPQAVYWAGGAAQFLKNHWIPKGERPVFCAPSGNFGNLTAALYAQAMGAPVKSFVAATNINRTFPDYLESGVYRARDSLATVSNAMDVGAPSNFERMAFHWTHAQMKANILSAYITDEETRRTIKKVHDGCGYFLDPHGAVGWAALDKLIEKGALPENETAAVAETAHPAKFGEVVEPLTGPVPVPPRIEEAGKRKVTSINIPANEEALFAVLV